MNNNINCVLKMVENLSSNDQKELVDAIMLMLQSTPVHSITCHDLVQDNTMQSRPNCPHCHALAFSGHIIKRGKKHGGQRYYCKECKKYFMPTTNTTFSHTRKDADTWREFIKLTLAGESLKKCSSICHISYKTAFIWRHKILNVLLVNQEKTLMDGVVEMDEMLISINYKGNHVQGHYNEKRRLYEGRENKMPRKSYRRGTDNKSMSSNDKVCVCCLVENGNKTFFAATPGVGFMKNDMLKAVVDKHVKKETAIVLVDQYKVTEKFLEKNNYRYKTLASNTSDNYKEHKPEIDGAFHLQHVNAMHRHIHLFLAKYCGVSSKYLCHYVALYVWLRTMKIENEMDLGKAYINTTSSLASYITYDELHRYPAIPQCAA